KLIPNWATGNCNRGFAMKQTTIDMPVLGLIAGTRGALGAGIGLLLSERLPRSQRRAVGWALLAVGVLTTIPLVMEVFGKRCEQNSGETDSQPELRMTV